MCRSSRPWPGAMRRAAVRLMEQHLASVERNLQLDPRTPDLLAALRPHPAMTDARYPRDLRGHGRTPPQARWPGNARVALQFVLNFEEGGENSVLHGDAGSEQFLSEMFNPPAFAARHLSMESIYEYGSRVGRVAPAARVRAPRACR